MGQYDCFVIQEEPDFDPILEEQDEQEDDQEISSISSKSSYAPRT